MNLSDIRDYLRGIFPETKRFFIGRVDTAQEKCIGIYDGEPLPAVYALGPKTYDTLSVSILVYWTDNARETEAAARALYDRLRAADFPEIGGHSVPLISLKHDAPQDCTRPDSPVYEQVIEAVFHYNL